MTALPHLRLASPADDWIPLANLAAAGIARRTLTRACATGDLKDCHRWRDNPNGGPRLIEVNVGSPNCPERYRAALRDAASAGSGSECGEAHALSEKNLARAAKIAALLQEVESALASAAAESPIPERVRIERFLAGKRALDPTVPSITGYYRFKKAWLKGGRSLTALADRRGISGGGVKAEFTEAAFSFFCGLYLTEDQRQATTCYEKLEVEAEARGWAVPSLATVLRTVKERIPKDRLTLLRHGEKRHHDRHEAFLLRDWSDMAANEFWVSDHCELDVIGIDDLPGGTGKPARMWLTTWMDEACRHIVGKRFHRGPNADQVLASFHDAILAEGIPDNIRIDNGKDYRCARFAGGRQWRTELVKLQVDEAALRPLMYDLGITPHYAIPYNARAKIIEPWHRQCIKEQFSKFCPGYCGGSIAEKPEILAEVIKQWEQTGNAGGGGLMTWSQLLPLLDEVIAGYHRRAHEGLNGQCPAMVRQQKLASITKRIADPRTAALFLPCRIVTCGTFLSIDGAHYGLGNVKLIERSGEKVKVRLDDLSAGRCYVYDLKGVYITTAENAGRIAAHATPEHVKESQKRIARHNKLAKEVADNASFIQSIDPAVALALQSTRGAVQPAAPDRTAGILPASRSAGILPASPSIFKPDFRRADDGTINRGADALVGRLPPHLRPLSPASDVLARDGNRRPTTQATPARTDSPAKSPDPGTLPDDLLGLLSAG